jgi:hypothetical protein
MRWRKSADDGDRGAFLEGTSSDLADFGHTGSEGFASAWDAQMATQAHDEPVDAFGPPEDDKRTLRSRDLDRRSRRGLLVLGVIVILGAGAALAVQQGVVSDPTGFTPETIADINVIASIEDPRDYSSGSSDVVLSGVAPINSAFVGSQDAHPSPAVDLANVSGGSAFGTLFWGGRSHVAILGPELDLTTTCVIVTLAAEDLRVVDLAAYGECGNRYAATADRSACIGDNVAILEVWPYDPDAVVPRPQVTTTRVRIESVEPDTMASESFRGSAPLDDQLLENAARMNGQPGDEATVQIGTVTGTCTLVDRAEVPVQLL